MAIIKCKMCGGDLDISEVLSVCECEYCGTKQTVPSADNEKKLTLFARAGRLRAANEFDKAAGVYETIVADFPEEAEAYWGLVLCRYGIEYVDDPATGKKVPTCHRVSFDSVLEDSDFEQSCENADAVARRQYREEAKQIEDIRRGIIEVSGKEEPYDIFICYKETDENGERTVDSVLAQDVYDALTERGYRVFFSRISLEDKLGTEYEPYIFAALNSVKIMLAFGTDFEYYNAVWVKNEWSRFLKLMEKDKGKLLIPCYKGIDAYDMPKEFQRLQGQDLSKVGAIQDLLRGIEKFLPRKGETGQSSGHSQQTASDTEVLLKRGRFSLEDRDWKMASAAFDKVLGFDPENVEAYLGKLLGHFELRSVGDIISLNSDQIKVFRTNPNFLRLQRFGSLEQKNELEALLSLAEEISPPLIVGSIYYGKCERTLPIAAFIEINGQTAMCHIKDLEYKRVERVEDVIKAGDWTWVKFLGKDERGRLNLSRKEAIKEREKAGLPTDRLSDAEQAVADISEQIRREALEHPEGIGELLRKYTVDRVKRERQEAQNRAEQERKEAEARVERERRETEEREKRRPILAAARERLRPCQGMIAAGSDYTVGLRSDGTILIAGENNITDKCQEVAWRNIVSITTGGLNTVGLRSNGTVFAVGRNNNCQCSFGGWTDIAAIAAGSYHAVGLRSDGTVVASKLIENSSLHDKGQFDVSGWSGIVAVVAGLLFTVGLRSDGTVLAVGSDDNGQCDVSGWTDIVAIAAGGLHTVGLRSDGTVLAVGNNDDGQCNVSHWRDIVAVSARGSYSVGLRSDGTVLAAGRNNYCQCNVSHWRNIVAIAAGISHTVGLRSDGTVLAMGRKDNGQCNAGNWKLFGTLDTLERERKEAAERAERERREAAERAEQERKEAAERAEQERREAAERAEKAWQAKLAALTSEKTSLQTELANLKGLFSGKRRKEIEARLAEIEAELKKL